MERVRLRVTAVRHADEADLPLLAGVEAAADAMFASVMDTSDWPPAADGGVRAAATGWILVVGQPVVGFAHVIDVGGQLHLEQIAVHPDAQRRGVGQMLLRAAFGTVLDAGHRTLTLMTYADVPWNGPWYARHGFVELAPQARPEVWAALALLRQGEDRLARAGGGRRIAMVRELTDTPEPVPAASVIPLRDGPDGLEVFVQHRASTMDFAPGAVVFPGGRRDPIDATLLDTAVREVAEETGALVTADALLPWDHWVTPVGSPRRFDVRFWVLPVTGGDDFGHTTTEATHSQWIGVDDLVAHTEAGLTAMVPPQRAILDELQALGSLAAVVSLQPRVDRIRHDILPVRRPRTARSAPGLTTLPEG
jgi:8-oxo-dGTP pyrophosphatase MutT (NUDIX family)/GNAT superfamily N-acetyltransferase